MRLGVFLHEKGREFWEQHHETTAPSLADEFAATQLKEELDRMKERLHAVREEEFKKGERRAEEYRREAEQRRRECEAERARCDKLIQGINAEVERASSARVDELGKQLAALKAKTLPGSTTGRLPPPGAEKSTCTYTVEPLPEMVAAEGEASVQVGEVAKLQPRPAVVQSSAPVGETATRSTAGPDCGECPLFSRDARTK